jgi:excisionase family DNA binding protein
MLGVSRSYAYANLISNGRLRTVKLGRRRLVPTAAISALVKELLEAEEREGPL